MPEGLGYSFSPLDDDPDQKRPQGQGQSDPVQDAIQILALRLRKRHPAFMGLSPLAGPGGAPMPMGGGPPAPPMGPQSPFDPFGGGGGFVPPNPQRSPGRGPGLVFEDQDKDAGWGPRPSPERPPQRPGRIFNERA